MMSMIPAVKNSQKCIPSPEWHLVLHLFVLDLSNYPIALLRLCSPISPPVNIKYSLVLVKAEQEICFEMLM